MTLRSPPVKGSVLALREALSSLGTFNGQSLNEVLVDLYDRVGVVIEPPVDPPVDPPADTSLWDESFQGGLDGEIASIGTTTASSSTGSGSLTHSDTWSLDGGSSLKIAGTSAHYLVHDNPTVDAFRAQFYYYHDVVPGETAYVWQVFAANGTTVAARVGITAAGLVYFQDSTTGTGAADDLSAVLVVASYYRFDVSLGAGVGTLSIYNLTGINSTVVGDAFDTLTITLTATQFSKEAIGLMNTLAAGGGGVSGNLVDEGFEGAGSGAPTTSTTTADQVTGSGSLTHSTTYAAEGTRGLRVNGTTSNMCRWDHTSHSDVFASIYLRFVTAPGTSVSWFYQARTGDDAASAFQVGISTDGRLRIRDATTGTPTIAAAALTTATNYRVDVSALGAGGLTMRYYTGANIDSSNTANAVEALTSVLTATNFADNQVGQVSTVTTAPDYYIDRFKADTAALPSPIGGAAGGPIGGYIERYKSDSATMPTPLVIDVGTDPPGPSGQISVILEPPTGKVWLGASTPAAGNNGTTAAGLAQYVAFAGARPKILHFYYPNWNGLFTTADANMLKPVGGAASDRAIPFVNVKLGQGQTFAQIAAGGADAAVNTFATNVRTYPHKLFVAVWHEQDNNLTTSQQRLDYAAAFRRIVGQARTRGLQPASQGGNVVFVWNQTGYSGNSTPAELDDMYPGDEYVDWIAWDPYRHKGGSPTDDPRFENIVEEDDVGGNDFYAWAAAKGKPLMLAEWGADYRTLSGSVTGFSDASNATWYATVAEDLVQYPLLKAIVHWNSTTDPNVTGAGSGIYYVQGRALSEAAFATMVSQPIFDIDMTEAP